MVDEGVRMSAQDDYPATPVAASGALYMSKTQYATMIAEIDGWRKFRTEALNVLSTAQDQLANSAGQTHRAISLAGRSGEMVDQLLEVDQS